MGVRWESWFSCCRICMGKEKAMRPCLHVGSSWKRKEAASWAHAWLEGRPCKRGSKQAVGCVEIAGRLAGRRRQVVVPGPCTACVAELNWLAGLGLWSGPYFGWHWACKMGCDEPSKNRPKVAQKLDKFKWALGPIKRIIKINKNKRQKHDKNI